MRSKLVVVLLILLIPLLCSGCFLFPREHLEIVEHFWIKQYYGNFDYWIIEVRGRAVNDGDYDLSQVSIQVKFYDTSNTVVKTLVDSTTDLEKGESWRFLIRYWTGTEPDHYEISVGTLRY